MMMTNNDWYRYYAPRRVAGLTPEGVAQGCAEAARDLDVVLARTGLRPGDRILEVGCGHGVLVSLLLADLTAGSVVAVDRSPAMIAAATRRNRAAVEAGRVRLQAATVADADLADGAFDVVVSFDVRAFWTPPSPEWDVVDRVLAPGGRVVVAFSLMAPDSLERIGAAVRRLAQDRGFEQAGVHQRGTGPIGSAALELRRGQAATRTSGS